MPPRLRLQGHLRVLTHNSRPHACYNPYFRPTALPIRCRGFSDGKDASDKEQDASATDAAPHVSEEAAQLSKVMGETGPDIEKGIPVEEVVKGDKKTQEKLPKVMKEELKSNNPPKGSRSFSTSTRGRLEEVQPPAAIEQSLEPAIPPGLKFAPPIMPLPPHSHLRSRSDDVVEQVTKLLMRDGKLSQAQRHMSIILTHLRTSPAPNMSNSRALLPNAPPPSHLPLHPILYLTLALDSVAPLMRIQALKGAAGGGMALQMPVPMTLRQRRRQVVMWILDAVEKRRGGITPFPKRFGEEVIAIVEGRSSIWDKRNAVHRLGVAARANLGFKPRRKK